jgi:hypothetical protein
VCVRLDKARHEDTASAVHDVGVWVSRVRRGL